MSVASFGRPAVEPEPEPAPAPPGPPSFSFPPTTLPLVLAIDEESLQAAYEAVRSTVRQAALDGLADAAKVGS